MHVGGGAQGVEQLRRRNAIGQGQFATSEHQHVAHLMLQLMQALLQAPGEALLLLQGQGLLGQVAGIQQGGG
ncbi:hypothetical protein D3C84_1110240 [compost metagenome]